MFCVLYLFEVSSKKVDSSHLDVILFLSLVSRIDPVERNRVRIVHPRWRRIFDDEDLQDELDRGEGEARLMICDRRR